MYFVFVCQHRMLHFLFLFLEGRSRPHEDVCCVNPPSRDLQLTYESFWRKHQLATRPRLRIQKSHTFYIDDQLYRATHRRWNFTDDGKAYSYTCTPIYTYTKTVNHTHTHQRCTRTSPLLFCTRCRRSAFKLYLLRMRDAIETKTSLLRISSSRFAGLCL